jgi:hypothetical protein
MFLSKIKWFSGLTWPLYIWCSLTYLSSIYLSTYLSIYLPLSLSIYHLYIYLSSIIICLFICLCTIYLPIYLPIIYLVLRNCISDYGNWNFCSKWSCYAARKSSARMSQFEEHQIGKLSLILWGSVFCSALTFNWLNEIHPHCWR